MLKRYASIDIGYITDWAGDGWRLVAVDRGVAYMERDVEEKGILGRGGLDRRSGKDRRKVDSAAYEIGMFRDRRKEAEVPLRERIAQALAKNGVPHYFNVADALIKELGL